MSVTALVIGNIFIALLTQIISSHLNTKMALAARWCRLALPEQAATSLTFALTNVCNLASLRHLCTPLNAIYLTDMFLQIRLTQSVTTFVISKLIKLFVRKYLFNCLS